MAFTMQGPVLQGVAASGFGGVKIIAFIAPSGDASRKIQELLPPSIGTRHIAHCESNGRLLFLACDTGGDGFLPRKIATYRREDHKFFTDMDFFLKRLRVQTIEDLCVSESHGAFTLTLLYTEAPSEETAGV